MKKKIKIGILGYGFMGKKHREVINSSELFELTAIIDHAKSHYEENNSIAVYSDLKSFIQSDRNTEAVVVATPNFLHFENAKELLHNNYHVIIEKPFCTNNNQVAELEDLSNITGKQVYSIMQNRNAPISVWLKDLLKKDILGDIYMVQTNCFWNRNENYYLPKSWRGTKQMDGGILFTQFSHFADMILWIFGDIQNVQAKLKTFRHKNLIEIEDTGSVNFDFVNGGMGNIQFTTAAYEKNIESSMTIIAENGSIKISGQYFDQIEFCNIKDYDLNNGLTATDNLRNLLQDYSNFYEIVHHTKVNTSVFEDGRMLISFLEKVYNTPENN